MASWYILYKGTAVDHGKDPMDDAGGMTAGVLRRRSWLGKGAKQFEETVVVHDGALIPGYLRININRVISVMRYGNII